MLRLVTDCFTNSVEEAVTKINEDLKLVSEWLKANKLKLNIKKRKA
jgi:hypothetical protein